MIKYNTIIIPLLLAMLIPITDLSAAEKKEKKEKTFKDVEALTKLLMRKKKIFEAASEAGKLATSLISKHDRSISALIDIIKIKNPKKFNSNKKDKTKEQIEKESDEWLKKNEIRVAAALMLAAMHYASEGEAAQTLIKNIELGPYTIDEIHYPCAFALARMGLPAVPFLLAEIKKTVARYKDGKKESTLKHDLLFRCLEQIYAKDGSGYTLVIKRLEMEIKETKDKTEKFRLEFGLAKIKKMDKEEKKSQKEEEKRLKEKEKR